MNMKLRNLMYATMIACAFSACSNDDDPTPTPGPDAADLDATLTVAFKADGAVKTRALGEATDVTFGEKENHADVMSTIAIAVFNNGAMTAEGVTSPMKNGDLISYAVIDNNYDAEKGARPDTTACVDAKSGDVQVLVIANPTTALNGLTTLKEFQQAINGDLANQLNGKLLMSSEIKSYTLSKGRNVVVAEGSKDVFKTLGTRPEQENILVYRNVAKVTLGSITIAPRNDFGGEKGKAKFTLKSVYVDRVRSSVSVSGIADGWCSVRNQYAKYLNGSKEKGNLFYNPEEEVVLDYSSTKSLDVNQNFYVYDNATGKAITGGRATRLVITGTYEYTTGNGGEIKSEDAFWYVDVNNNDLAATDTKGEFPDHWGVLRNVHYTLNVSITGPGKPSAGEDPTDPTDPVTPPDPVDPTDPDVPVDPEEPVNPNPDGEAANLTAKIVVVSWGTVIENPDID